ncbi:CBN-INSC-1 protein [Aphelenchoides besseyi]|nr:CBN-INSC-1 protein [Aphelenchoides besseyi]KAI6194403.1 CBN-INSC-1 protein [Aphelenchoides besseyi]
MVVDPEVLSAVHSEWIRKMRDSAQLETMTVLYAKSATEILSPTRVAVRVDPPKVQTNGRYVAKIRSTTGDTVSWRPRTENRRRSPNGKRTRRIRSNPPVKLRYAAPSSYPSSSCESLAQNRRTRAQTPSPVTSRSSSTDAPSSIVSSRFALSLPSCAHLKEANEWHDQEIHLPDSEVCVSKRSATVQPNAAALRHSIRVNDDPTDDETTRPSCRIAATDFSNSPSSACSVDSGQCSGGTTIPQSMWPNRSSSAVDSLNPSLPSYPRVASHLDHILRIAGTVFTLLDAELENERIGRELVQKVSIYIQTVRQSLCNLFISEEDLRPVISTVNEVLNSSGPFVLSDHFLVAVRRLLEQTLLVFVRVITVYLSGCSNSDRLLTIALDHFVHLLLFGDELCVEAVRWKSVDHVVGFCRMRSTVDATRQLLLRSLAVLCGVPKGCVQLISIGGLEVILTVLRHGSIVCAVEAAGVLVQLISPHHAFVRLQKREIDSLIVRLLQLVDGCRNAESLLLCTAAVANCSQQSSSAVTALYEHNAVMRIVRAAERPENANIFVFEQAVVIFARLAACSYHGVLIAQGAVSLLLEMLKISSNSSQARPDYCRRVKYKAAVCLGTIAASGTGLKALHEQDGIEILNHVIQTENNNTSTPFYLICSSIRQRLNSVYRPLESVV